MYAIQLLIVVLTAICVFITLSTKNNLQRRYSLTYYYLSQARMID